MSEKKQNTAKLRVGYIGAGLMGHGAAKNILEKGNYPLTVIANRNRAPVEDLVGRGAHEARAQAPSEAFPKSGRSARRSRSHQSPKDRWRRYRPGSETRPRSGFCVPH